MKTIFIPIEFECCFCPLQKMLLNQGFGCIAIQTKDPELVMVAVVSTELESIYYAFTNNI